MPNKRKPPMIRLAQWNITIEYSTSELRDAKTKTYEDRVHVIVNAIAHTNIGKCLFKTLHDPQNPDAGVWIVQLTYLGWILKNWRQTKSPRR